jgi:hypothetical protein
VRAFLLILIYAFPWPEFNPLAIVPCAPHSLFQGLA